MTSDVPWYMKNIVSARKLERVAGAHAIIHLSTTMWLRLAKVKRRWKMGDICDSSVEEEHFYFFIFTPRRRIWPSEGTEVLSVNSYDMIAQSCSGHGARYLVRIEQLRSDTAVLYCTVDVNSIVESIFVRLCSCSTLQQVYTAGGVLSRIPSRFVKSFEILEPKGARRCQSYLPKQLHCRKSQVPNAMYLGPPSAFSALVPLAEVIVEWKKRNIGVAAVYSIIPL